MSRCGKPHLSQEHLDGPMEPRRIVAGRQVPGICDEGETAFLETRDHLFRRFLRQHAAVGAAYQQGRAMNALDVPPQESTGATNWFAVAAGIGYTVALKSGGTQPTPTPIPATSAWGLAVLTATLLAMSAILLRRTSGHRPAARP